MADMTLEEALEAATVDEELISPVNEVLMINPETRTINVPDSEKLFGARQDMGVERKYFKCPRIVGDNIDLSKHRIFVNYVPSKQDGTYNLEDDVQGYWCKDLAVDGDFITFSWEISGNVTRSAGYIAFAVYAKTIDENGNLKTKWHTTIAIGNVLETLPDGEEWIAVYPDIVMQLLERMDEVEKNGGNGTSDAVQYIEQALTEEQQTQARTNIGAASKNEVSKLSEDIATKASAIKETASGETIVVTDSAEEKPLGLAIDGKSEQTQYSGRNVLNINVRGSATHLGMTYTINPNGTVTLNGTTTETGSFGTTITNTGIKAGKYYITPVGNNNIEARLAYTEDGSTWKYIFENESAEMADFNTYNQVVYQLIINGGVTMNNQTIYPIISTDGGAWEPYCGGIPSPNPSYPQEIRNIGVYDEASGKYAVEVKCTGKNLINFEEWANKVGIVKGKSVYENNGITITSSGDDCYTSFWVSEISNVYTVPVKEGMELALSWEEDTNANGEVYIFPNGDIMDGIVYVNNSSAKELMYTAGKGITFITFRFGVQNANTTISYKNIMLRYANTSTDYEPYKETTATVYLDEPLRGIGEVTDRINFETKKRNNRIGMVNVAEYKVFDWGAGGGGHDFYIELEKTDLNTTINLKVKCNKFKPRNPKEEWNIGEVRYAMGDSGWRDKTRLCFRVDSEIDTVAKFKEYVGNDCIAIYERVTPITEEIDLSLDGLSMFYPTTILSNDCNANMEVEYIADTKAYIDKKFAELATAMV